MFQFLFSTTSGFGRKFQKNLLDTAFFVRIALCVLWIINNQLKVDRIFRDKHGEKKKIIICVSPVNHVQKDISFPIPSKYPVNF